MKKYLKKITIIALMVCMVGQTTISSQNIFTSNVTCPLDDTPFPITKK